MKNGLMDFWMNGLVAGCSLSETGRMRKRQTKRKISTIHQSIYPFIH
jgi:hypothetical protein